MDVNQTGLEYIHNYLFLYSSSRALANDHCTTSSSYPSFILTHSKGIPFGRKSGFGERRRVCVALCALFNALHADGWRAQAKCNLDSRKRRSSVLFRFSPHEPPPSDVEYAIATVTGDRDLLLEVVPAWAEVDVRRQIEARAARQTAHPVGALHGSRLFKTFLGSNARYAAVAHQVQHFKSSTPKEFSRAMGLILAVIGAMKDVGFDLEVSFSVFGDQQDILMFAYRSAPKR